jgi:hypothetical protein
MMRSKYFVVLILLITSISGFSQDGEKLTTINYNLELLRQQQHNELSISRSSDFYYYAIDTLNLPFIDDFSSNRFTYYHLPLFPQADIIPAVAVNFTVDGNLVDTLRFMRSKSYLYLNAQDSIEHPSFVIQKYEAGQFPKNPYRPVETFTAWPTYFRIFENNGILDTIAVIPDGVLILDTISNYIVNVAPKNTLWLDSDVYINNSMAVNPPSIGVVTFDGLRDNGLAYVPGLPNVINQKGIADYLTSKPINLNYLPQDSVHFSFYYQPQGYGNAPEGIDSLVVEFYSPLDSLWKNQWSIGGRALQDFTQVIIPITDSMFLQNGFQFRFKNYADLSGNLDHWHVDYIRLFAGRDRANVHPEDVAFNRPASSLLKNYREMPWNQYVANPANEMNQNLTVYMRNNSGLPKVLNYTFNILNQGGSVIATQSSVGSESALTSFAYSNNIGINFPTSTAAFEQFTVENIIYTSVDELRQNDTIRHIQKFDNFYAYDDGVPEAGYGLNKNGAKLAYRFVANTPDDLTSVRIHFTPINVQTQIYPFKLTVWSSLNPETIIYQDEDFSYPSHPATLLGFAEYVLPSPVKVSGNFFVGFVQVTSTELNVGFDKSFDTKERIFYNLDGTWINTIFSGSLMIRPVLGPSNDPTVGIAHLEKPKQIDALKVYPNPAKNTLFIDGITENAHTTISLYDLYGRKVIYLKDENLSRIDLSGLADGMYILKVENIKSGFNHTAKIMVNR